MSRGLGKVERALLRCLRSFPDMVGPLGITWSAGGSFARRYLVTDVRDVERFERGEIVEVRRLMRETGAGKAVLSRALRSLDRKGLVLLYADDLALRRDNGRRAVAKFSGLTRDGDRVAAALSANKSQTLKLALIRKEEATRMLREYERGLR